MASIVFQQVSIQGCNRSPSCRRERWPSSSIHTPPTPSFKKNATWKLAASKSASEFLSYGNSKELKTPDGFRTRNFLKAVTTCSEASTSAPMTIAVTGASGFVGSALVRRLSQEGHLVKVLARSSSSKYYIPLKGVSIVGYNDWESAIKGCSGVVNLAGEPISARWTPAIKAEILDSRVRVTNRIAAAVNACSEESRPAVLVSASALGFYGTSETARFDEASGSGSDYLSKVCIEWEKSAKAAETARTVILRLGIVLEKDGGALAKMLPIFQLGAGGPMGTGNQWFSWVHMDDVIGLIMQALTEPTMEGVYNATGPTPVRMEGMCTSLANATARISWLPVPGFALQAILGEGASVVLEGQQVIPTRTLLSGYKFKYDTVDKAVRAVVQSK
mmetsp:Transcript_7/g.17  ORF Transcript_7/g.17 Transcript_7/m.17 type:complete len:390 (-) Transcript_7:259-1428(-)|eukprot:CAMPEP_0198211202 /NCGR_PEP_ID=MMETSP1445-20131203/22683_1 /TAXON_ID=36898 /ORGANISM="Pyramimonas sp., Strain CCMP2087" /LENGTH=389 /DNA_ID=CAMNT_0043885415 /DNA_START=33 /DNA_END=1202 /DNA_ORIENTATION=-